VSIELKTGTFETTLDDKGRVGIPAKLRERYCGELIITQGMPPSLSAWLMLPDVWEEVQKNFENAVGSLTWEKYQNLRYQFVLPAQVVEFDKFGRIMIPAAIRTYVGLNAGLIKDCLVLSDTDHLEIWDAHSFYNHLRERRQANQDTMGEMGAVRLFGSRNREGGAL
jgi:MraZ protein